MSNNDDTTLQDDCAIINPDAEASDLYDGASLRLENALGVLMKYDDPGVHCAWSQVYEAKRLMRLMHDKLMAEKIKASRALHGVDVEDRP